MMRLFTRMLGRFAGDIATVLLPFGGFYLAGGVAQKELRWLEGEHLFMKWFENTFNPNIKPLLQKLPVYLIKDYSISIYGAANACQRLSPRLNP
jgi:glucokinase